MGSEIFSYFPELSYIFAGIKVTLFYTVGSLLGGCIFSFFLVFMRFSKIRFFVLFSRFYVSIFRGTPLLLQLWLFYYGGSHLTGINLEPWEAGILSFSLNSAAYLSEIIRSGIRSIDKGQWEAAQVLGISYGRTLRDIILPQAIRHLIPSFVNEAGDLLKESSLVSTITEADLMRRANLVASQHHSYFLPYLFAALCYYVMVLAISGAARYLDKKLNKSKNGISFG